MPTNSTPRLATQLCARAREPAVILNGDYQLRPCLVRDTAFAIRPHRAHPCNILTNDRISNRFVSATRGFLHFLPPHKIVARPPPNKLRKGQAPCGHSTTTAELGDLTSQMLMRSSAATSDAHLSAGSLRRQYQDPAIASSLDPSSDPFSQTGPPGMSAHQPRFRSLPHQKRG